MNKRSPIMDKPLSKMDGKDISSFCSLNSIQTKFIIMGLFDYIEKPNRIINKMLYRENKISDKELFKSIVNSLKNNQSESNIDDTLKIFPKDKELYAAYIAKKLISCFALPKININDLIKKYNNIRFYSDYQENLTFFNDKINELIKQDDFNFIYEYVLPHINKIIHAQKQQNDSLFNSSNYASVLLGPIILIPNEFLPKEMLIVRKFVADLIDHHQIKYPITTNFKIAKPRINPGSSESPAMNRRKQLIGQHGGTKILSSSIHNDIYHQKYIKYKHKYLNMKNKI